jgi:hypothetical protein
MLGSRFYIGYAGDTRTPIGGTLGLLRQRKIGWYLSGKWSGTYFYGGGRVEHELDQKGQLIASDGTVLSNDKDGNVYAKPSYRLEPTSYIASFNVTVGLSKRIVYPLWAYAGIGVSDDVEFRKFSIDTDNVTKTARCRGTEKVAPMLDLGVILNVGRRMGCVMNAGLSTTFASSMKFCPSFGVQLGF